MREYKHSSVADGYKMVGNAVPVNMAYALANKIMQDFALISFKNNKKINLLVG